MSDDLDFDMEVVKNDELDEMGSDGPSTSEESLQSGERDGDGEVKRKAAGSDPDRGNTRSTRSSGSPGRSRSERRKSSSSIPEEQPVPGDEIDVRVGPRKLHLPSNWAMDKLSNIFSLTSGVSYSSDEIFEEAEGARLLTLKSVSSGGGYNRDSEKFYTGDLKEEHRVGTGDLVIANTDVTQDGNVIGYPARVPNFGDEKPVGISLDLSALRPKTGRVNKVFAEYLLRTEFVHSRMRAFSAGSTVLHLNLDLARSLTIPLPPLPEQRKIASVLYTVDQAIQKTEAIIEQAKRVKRGLVQDLFTHGLNDAETQRIRPGEFPKSWEIKALGEVANVVRGNTPDTSNENYYGGENVWVTPNDLSNLYEDGVGKYIADSERKLTESGIEAKSLSLVRPNSVMFTSRSYGIGKTAICTVPAATNQGITAFECENELREEFLYYYLNHIMDYIVSISGVATFPEITKRGVEGLPVPVPDLNTQKTLTAPLSRLDDLIDHEMESKEGLKYIKKGLMQDLLTGEVRTTDKAIEVLDEVEAHG